MNNTITDILYTHIKNQLLQHGYQIDLDQTGKSEFSDQFYSRILAHKFITINLKKHIIIQISPSGSQRNTTVRIHTEESRAKNNRMFIRPPEHQLTIQIQDPSLLEKIDKHIKT